MRTLTLFCFLALLLVSGCGGGSGSADLDSFMREDVELSFINRVAVLPFENNTDDKLASERVRDVSITQVLSSGLFDVVDKSIVDNALNEEAIDLDKSPIDQSTMSRLGQRLNVQAFLLGSVDQSGEVRRGSISYYEIALSLRLLDINSGIIFWNASGTQNGDSTAKRLLGLARDDEFIVTTKLLRKLLGTVLVEEEEVVEEEVVEEEEFELEEPELAPAMEPEMAEPDTEPEE